MSYQHIPSHNPIIRVDVGLNGKNLDRDKLNKMGEQYEDKKLPVFKNDADRLACFIILSSWA